MTFSRFKKLCRRSGARTPYHPEIYCPPRRAGRFASAVSALAALCVVTAVSVLLTMFASVSAPLRDMPKAERYDNVEDVPLWTIYGYLGLVEGPLSAPEALTQQQVIAAAVNYYAGQMNESLLQPMEVAVVSGGETYPFVLDVAAIKKLGTRLFGSAMPDMTDKALQEIQKASADQLLMTLTDRRNNITSSFNLRVDPACPGKILARRGEELSDALPDAYYVTDVQHSGEQIEVTVRVCRNADISIPMDDNAYKALQARLHPFAMVSQIGRTYTFALEKGRLVLVGQSEDTPVDAMIPAYIWCGAIKPVFMAKMMQTLVTLPMNVYSREAAQENPFQYLPSLFEMSGGLGVSLIPKQQQEAMERLSLAGTDYTVYGTLSLDLLNNTAEGKLDGLHFGLEDIQREVDFSDDAPPVQCVYDEESHLVFIVQRPYTLPASDNGYLVCREMKDSGGYHYTVLSVPKEWAPDWETVHGLSMESRATYGAYQAQLLEAVREHPDAALEKVEMTLEIVDSQWKVLRYEKATAAADEVQETASGAEDLMLADTDTESAVWNGQLSQSELTDLLLPVLWAPLDQGYTPEIARRDPAAFFAAYIALSSERGSWPLLKKTELGLPENILDQLQLPDDDAGYRYSAISNEDFLSLSDRYLAGFKVKWEDLPTVFDPGGGDAQLLAYNNGGRKVVLAACRQQDVLRREGYLICAEKREGDILTLTIVSADTTGLYPAAVTDSLSGYVYRKQYFGDYQQALLQMMREDPGTAKQVHKLKIRISEAPNPDIWQILEYQKSAAADLDTLLDDAAALITPAA